MSETEPITRGTFNVATPERENRRHSFEEIKGGIARGRIAIHQDEMIIGREPCSHIRLFSDRASRRHATLCLRGTDCILTDNDSRHGVILNGVRIHSAILREGDVVQMGEAVFIYHED